MESCDKLNYLSSNIDDCFLHPINSNAVSFIESGTDAKLKRINFVGFDKVVPIDQDKFSLGPKKNFFKFKGYNKTCDGVFFLTIDEKPIVLIFDVKSSRSNSGDHILKMKAGENFVNYIKSTSKIFSNIDFSEFQCFFCIFYKEISPKRETSFQIEVSSDPNNPSYIAVDNDDVISARRILGLRVN